LPRDGNCRPVALLAFNEHLNHPAIAPGQARNRLQATDLSRTTGSASVKLLATLSTVLVPPRAKFDKHSSLFLNQSKEYVISPCQKIIGAVPAPIDLLLGLPSQALSSVSNDLSKAYFRDCFIY